MLVGGGYTTDRASGDVVAAADVGALKIVELRAALKARGLPTSGKKAELAQRLRGAS